MDVLDDLHAALDGRYEIVREIGRGGMAVVFLAHDHKHDRDVAIKVLPPEMAAGLGTERFLHEIRTAAHLSHPNILPLHDSIAVGQVRCYVMPYVQGESLRQRLDRERQLGIDQAVDITRQVAAGLDYAHAHGVIHRDIKPENILLVGDQAMIADFGLARAVFSASSEPLTASGLAVGTPAYMSPEQAAADRAVDGRTDVYSLGCLFFEMVAGMPPFRGATAAAIIAAHATRTPPSLCAERASCPAGMDAAVLRALAKVPADRYRTAGEFAHALEAWRTSGSMAPIESRGRRRLGAIAAAAAAALVVGASVVAVPRVLARVALDRIPLDSSRVVVLPFSGSGGRHVTAGVAHDRVLSALTAWRDLRVVEPPPGATAATGDPARAGETGRRNGAARVLMATVAPMGDSIEVRATLYDARGDPARQESVRVADDARAGEERYRQLAASLLRTSDGEDDADDANPGTSRVAAWRAFTRGDSARRAWSLPVAEAEFRRAVTLDPQFARAHLWLAQVVAWGRPLQKQEWGIEAGRAVEAHALSPLDSMSAAGLVQLASARYPESCETYRRMHLLTPTRDLPWFGIAYCNAYDGAVERASSSPSGWRFRGSTYSAVSALDSAIARTTGAPGFAFELLGAMLIAEPTRKRKGHGLPPDTTTYYATPGVQHDTLGFVPYPAHQFEQGKVAPPASFSAALQFARERLESEYELWSKRAPGSAQALIALAYAQELQGEPEALSTTRKARLIARDSDELRRLSINEVRLLVKLGRLGEARDKGNALLGDSGAVAGDNVAELAGVAALLGNVPRTGELIALATRRHPDAVFHTRYPIPVQVLDVASFLLAETSAGVCSDSVARAMNGLDRLLEQYAPKDQQPELQRALLARSRSLAVPCFGARSAIGIANPDLLVRLQQRVAAGDVTAARAALDSFQAARRGMRPGDAAIDHTFQEAWALLALGDSAGASRSVDLSLGAPATLSTHILDDVPAAAAIGRAMSFRADLASALGDRNTARMWAQRVLALWGAASPELHPVLKRMEVLARH